MTTTITFDNGDTHKLISRWWIPTHLQHDYLTGESVIFDSKDNVEIMVPFCQDCQLCDREFTETTHPHPQCCQVSEINQHIGYVAKICVDCYYWLEKEQGSKSVPRSIMKTLEAGHRPVRFTDLLDKWYNGRESS